MHKFREIRNVSNDGGKLYAGFLLEWGYNLLYMDEIIIIIIITVI